MNKVLKTFPDIKLSYDKQLHNKVSCDIYSISPRGCKSIIWFTYEEETPILYIFHYKNNNIVKTETPLISFNHELSIGKGTIIQGTLFHIKGLSHFSMSNILYYKGEESKLNFNKSLELKFEIMQNYIKQTRLSKEYIVIGLPYMTNVYKDAEIFLSKVSYNTQGIVFHSNERYHSYGILVSKVNKENNDSFCVFIVKSTDFDDIYHLYIDDNYYNDCCVPTYKTSKFLNTLFKKNCMNTIDSIEESDDENEFEKKNIFNEVEKRMKCRYHKKFNKWEPYEETEDKCSILNKIKSCES